MKKVLIVPLIFCLTLAALIVRVNADQTSAAARASEISLQTAISTAVDKDNNIKLLGDKISLAERRLSSAISASKDAPEKYWGTDAQHIANKKVEILYPLQRQAELNELKWQLENTKKNLSVAISELYHNILFKQQEIKNQEVTLARAQSEYDLKNKQVGAGTLSKSSLLSYKITVDEASARLVTLKRDLESKLMDLKMKLGLDINQIIVLKNEDLPEKILNVSDIEKLVTDVLAASHSIKKLESDKLLAEKEYEIIANYSMIELPDEAEGLQDKALNLGYSIRDEKMSVELKVRSDYNSLLNLKDDITIKKLDYDMAVKLLDVAKVRYNVGLTNLLELQKAQGSKDNAFVEYNRARLDYYIAYETFCNYIYPVELK